MKLLRCKGEFLFVYQMNLLDDIYFHSLFDNCIVESVSQDLQSKLLKNRITNSTIELPNCKFNIV